MALFGNRYAGAVANAAKSDAQAVQTAPTAPAPRRGLFGRVGQFLTPHRLQVIGHTLQEIGGQEGALDGYLARHADEQAQALQQQRQMVLQRREDQLWDRQEAKIAALNAWVETLTPEQRAAARANPEAAYEAFMTSQTGGWETNGTTPYRVGANGEVIMGSGTIPHRPRASAQSEAADPDGWVYE